MNQIISNDRIIVDGKQVPSAPKSKDGSSNVAVIGNKIYANGYEYKNGKWKRSLIALFYKWF